jgi:hypothetical protein
VVVEQPGDVDLTADAHLLPGAFDHAAAGELGFHRWRQVGADVGERPRESRPALQVDGALDHERPGRCGPPSWSMRSVVPATSRVPLVRVIAIGAPDVEADSLENDVSYVPAPRAAVHLGVGREAAARRRDRRPGELEQSQVALAGDGQPQRTVRRHLAAAHLRVGAAQLERVEPRTHRRRHCNRAGAASSS